MAHMSNQWVFRHGAETVNMQHAFTRSDPSTGRLEVGLPDLLTSRPEKMITTIVGLAGLDFPLRPGAEYPVNECLSCIA